MNIFQPTIIKPQKLAWLIFIPGIFLLSLGMAAYAAPQLLAYMLAFISIFFGTFFVVLGYKIYSFINRFSKLQKGFNASVSIQKPGTLDRQSQQQNLVSLLEKINFQAAGADEYEERLGEQESETQNTLETSTFETSTFETSTFETIVIDEDNKEKKIIFH